MALNLKTLADELKKRVGNYFTPEYNQGKNFWSSPVAKGFANVQRGVQKFNQVPRFEFKPSTNPNPILRTGINVAKAIPESIINIPRNYAVGITRTGTELGDARAQKRPLNLQNLAAGLAPLGESFFDIGTMGGATLAKGMVKGASKQVLKGGFKQAVKQGALKGAAYGAGGGLTYGLDKQYGKRFDLGEVAGSVATGGVLGGVLGGGLSGASATLKLLKYKPEVEAQLRNNIGQWAKGQTPVKPRGMPKPQWDFQLKVNGKLGRNPHEPIMPRDLQQAIDLGMSVRAKGGTKAILDADAKNVTKAGISKKLDLNYLAGIVDGEGHIRLTPAKNGQGRSYLRPDLIVVQNNRKMLDKLQETFGGRISKQIKPNWNNTGTRELYRWELNGSKAVNLVKQIEPMLIEKAEQAKRISGIGYGPTGRMIKETIPNPNVAQQPLGDVTKAVGSMPEGVKMSGLPKTVEGVLPSSSVRKQPLPLSQTPRKLYTDKLKSEGALDTIIAQGRKQIGGRAEEPKTSFKQSIDNLYTQWVDRYNPIIQASQKAKGTLKVKGAMLRPENDPEYLVRRLTGAGGIADQQFKTKLEPILKQVEGSGIPKLDMDTYLASKRIAGFGKAGRDVYGADPQKATQIVGALETKYPQIKQFADQLYEYQNKGFQEMVDAGFISPENAKIIRGQNPDYSPIKRVMDEVNDYLGLPTRKTMQGSQPIQKLKGSTRQIESPLESIIGNTFSQRAAIEKNRVARSIIGLQEIAPQLGFSKAKEAGESTITVWKNGQKEYWNVGKDIADVAKGVNEEAMNLVLKVLQAPAALLRQGATGRNPEFMIPNIVRDQLDAGVTSKYGYIPFIDYISGLKSMVSNDDIYKKWAGSGAKIDLGEMSGKKSIQGYFDTATHKRKLFGWLGKTLDVMGKYSEQPTRVGLFKRAYKKTGNDLIAALESRDSTVDFARMGSKMKVANSIVPFLNVGIQGFDKLIRSVKNNPAKVLLNATLYGSVPAITTTVYNLVNHPKEYSEIPQYEKDSNFVLVTGRNENGTVDYLTFPKGNVLPTITNPVQSFIDYLFGNDQQSFKEMALQTLSSALPVIGDGQSMQEIGLKTIGSNLPQVFKPITESILNKSFYKYDPKKEQTKDIVPFYLQDKEPYKQAYKFTPQMYQKIGQLFNVSPLKVQNLMEGYLAGYSKIPAQVVEMMYKTSKGEEVSPNEKTILRRFIKQTYPSSGTKTEVKKSTTPSVMERLGLVTKAAEKTGNIITYTKDDKDYEVDLDKSFEYPKYDRDTAIGKEAISRYKSGISTQINKIYDAMEAGAITEEVASEKINALSIAYDKTKKAKKPKKITFKVSKFKAPTITLKKKSTIKPLTFKLKKPKKQKIVRKYTIK